ncbi:MAG: hypothetical protein CVV13_08820 [Gammaproteobacteria bacterium HGW-Gammaproteobacteria-3]|nr:MAG: hypothetical protein CVV13_08820 [Gammaproteobacteria bacterium HGW-Gammaproteobacteria-3]
MAIFNNSDFLALKPLDLENKLFLPTSQLYTQTVSRLNSLYLDIKQALIDFHSALATQAQDLYQHPVETTSAWYGQAVDYGANVYASISGQWLPKAEAAYQQSMIEVSELGQQFGQFWQTFYDNPEAVTISLIAPVSTHFTNMIDASGSYISSTIAVSEAYLKSLYSALTELFNLLLEQPELTLNALYQNTLSALLEIYFGLVSSLVTVL